MVLIYVDKEPVARKTRISETRFSKPQLPEKPAPQEPNPGLVRYFTFKITGPCSHLEKMYFIRFNY